MRRKQPQPAPTAPVDTMNSIANNTDLAQETLLNSAERLERLADRYRELATALNETT